VTGGADRKVKVWEKVNGNYTLKGTMHGSNAGIMSVQIDPQVGFFYYFRLLTRGHLMYKDIS